jgi:hypothetical protein
LALPVVAFSPAGFEAAFVSPPFASPFVSGFASDFVSGFASDDDPGFPSDDSALALERLSVA